MPELPEVETVCWRLREGGHGEPALVGRRIEAVTVLDPKVDVGAVPMAMLVGARVVDVHRRAKWIVIDTNDTDAEDRDSRRHLLLHLKMTGDVHVRPASDTPRFARFRFDLDGGLALVFTDSRRFGHAAVVDDDDLAATFADLGPEPLADDFHARDLAARLHGRRPIKASLLDQHTVAGVGNIYADESLWAARIHPLRPTNSLDDDEIVRLHHAIRRALRDSIADARIALAWRYENRQTPSPFRVYERAGLPCLRCGQPLSSLTVAGRTTVVCARCQPL